MGAGDQVRARCADPVERVQMTPEERRAARVAMARGERIATLLVGAAAGVASIVRGVERGLRALARTKPVS